MRHPFVVLVFLVASPLAFPSRSYCAEANIRLITPAVDFDVTPTVECTDVTTENFATSHPSEKLIEMVLRLSSRLVNCDEEEIYQVQFDVLSPEERLQVLTFSPRTTLHSDIVGDLKIAKSSETIRSLGASLDGHVHGPYGNFAAGVTPSADAGITRKNSRTESATKLSPKSVVVASGTLHHRHGVFYKLKPSSQTAFEDEKEFRIQWIVPREWRGDWIEVRCQADCKPKTLVFERIEVCGNANLLVGLYLAGDAEAQEAAMQLAKAQARSKDSPIESDKFQEPIAQFLRNTNIRLRPRLPAVGDRRLLPKRRDELTTTHQQPSQVTRSESVRVACEKLARLAGQGK